MFAVLIFAVLLVVAAGFAAWPVLRLKGKPRRARVAMAAALVLLVFGIGGGLYLVLGRPDLALRNTNDALKGHDVRALVALLAQKVRDTPDDPRGFVFLGRGYLTLNDPAMAAKAFARALALEQRQKKVEPGLYSAYGEALTRAAMGIVTPDAENAFRSALALDPKDPAARYYLGLAYAARGQAPQALFYWESLLGDLPTSALRSELVDRVAALRARAGGGPPDISAMVAGLAARLKTQPDDPEGWQRLVRAYSVLGDTQKAKAALADGRTAMAKNPQARAALDAEAKSLKLDQ
ncbi:MAG TPA: tetratricopeptide repeat protein [Rhizomicrobium sp.]|nr:tetratricopeptide repeat protein [Rhizomicrobium sp.]